jgi:hypothetical protein
VDVRGIGDDDVEAVALEPVRQRDRADEHVRRNRARGIPVDTFGLKVDERQMRVIGGDTRDAGALGDAFVDERLGQGSCTRARASLGQPIGRHEARGLEQVGYELRDRVRLDARPRMRLGLDRRCLLAVRSYSPQELLKVFGGFHLEELSAKPATP